MTVSSLAAASSLACLLAVCFQLGVFENSSATERAPSAEPRATAASISAGDDDSVDVVQLERSIDRLCAEWRCTEAVKEAEILEATLRRRGTGLSHFSFTPSQLLDKVRLAAGWERERAEALAGPTPVPSAHEHWRKLHATTIERRAGAELSLKEFYTEYALTDTPVIITGLQSEILPTPWSLQHLLDHCGGYGRLATTMVQKPGGGVGWDTVPMHEFLQVRDHRAAPPTVH
jgi:hypothetical protein